MTAVPWCTRNKHVEVKRPTAYEGGQEGSHVGFSDSHQSLKRQGSYSPLRVPCCPEPAIRVVSLGARKTHISPGQDDSFDF